MAVEADLTATLRAVFARESEAAAAAIYGRLARRGGGFGYGGGLVEWPAATLAPEPVAEMVPWRREARPARGPAVPVLRRGRREVTLDG